eukprot:g5321.t1
MRAKYLAHGSDTLVISAVPWAEFPDANFSDIRTTLPASQCLLPPENPDELIATGAKMAREWLYSKGCALKKKKRSFLTYRGLLWGFQLGFLCARLVEETMVPGYVRRAVVTGTPPEPPASRL